MMNECFKYDDEVKATEPKYTRGMAERVCLTK